MSFELRDRDLLGRIGRLNTKSGVIETPAFMPVINPVHQSLSPRRMYNEFGCEIIITNSYIAKKNFGENQDLEIHRLLDYPGVIATDSGAYQLLVYGDVEVTQEEIIEFQKRIGSDIAVILDIPTGWDVPRGRVEYTVEETLNRAREAIPQIEDDEILWVGPIQGGRHLDLVAHSAKKIGELPYQIHALGSPTEVMERYNFSLLVDMIMAAKNNIPPSRPLHLFGAGHPMMLPLAVALGCDLFDSAAYALYAKDDRYLTPRGTLRLEDIRYLPCDCPICRNHSTKDVKNSPSEVRTRMLAEHNLHVTMGEIDRIKQSIVDGTLWDLVETRAKSHPSMTSALKRLSDYSQDLEEGSPGFKGKGVFYYDYHSLHRPETTRYIRKLIDNYVKTFTEKTLLLFKAPPTTPYRLDEHYLELKEKLPEEYESNIRFYSAPFGCVPEELSETFPLSQFEIAKPLDDETISYAVELLEEYISSEKLSRIIIATGNEKLDLKVVKVVNKIAEETSIDTHVIKARDLWCPRGVSRLSKLLIKKLKTVEN